MNDLAINISSATIPFEEGMSLPAYLQDLEADLQAYTAGMLAGFPVLSIKGKSFAVVRDGKRTIVTRPDDPDAPANYVDAIFLKSNPALSKVYYLKGYEEGSAAKPDCFSNDGQRPDPGSTSPQAKSCVTCPHNVFGTGSNGSGKACSDSRRIAVAALSSLDDPMLLRVPPGSFKNLAKYAQYLSQRGIKSMAGVLTRIKFDADEATPKLVFSPRALLAADVVAEVKKIANTDLVAQIIGVAAMPHEDDDTPLELPKVTMDDVAKAVQTPKPAPAPEPEAEPEEEAPKPKRQVKPKVEVEAVAEAVVTPVKPAPVPPAKPSTPADDMDSLNAALDDLLGEYDG